ncbi:MAG: HlyD family type I secretion periplasmic adaptor subunit [Paludibacterium sp.]|uniref:HlyD family type I secretion periplasmic adaptor subunit n=1 Tax=Paludibacterium sp. TaxID=1917523 RepID=UPI0025DE721C|nr:HlyD family type I secretion periplasmic adaptor subunit [Paludibacterium sp.]MBV8048233.1 HlyD family type I secretion periplasmic adaptor subunit [Paludibacterium sp.]MBV8647105.1 HlyD family type I secretion periplasmic adaptor subunit [Paludibacterium sp.]
MMRLIHRSHVALKAARHHLGPLFDRLTRWAAGRELAERADFAADAEWARLQQHPARPRLFIWSSGGLLACALLWAALAQVDEVARGEGKVVPSFQNQHIQSLDGGVVEQILVREGQKVVQDQLLLRIDSTRAQSSLQENRAQHLALQAKAARLRALAAGQPLAMPEDVRQQAPEAAQQALALFRSRQSELEASLSIARAQRGQRQQELSEARARLTQAEHHLSLAQRELDVTAPLKAAGAVSEVDLMRLQRELARALGERDAARAQVGRLQAGVSEAERKIQEVELSFRNAASNELSEVMARIDSLSAGSIALKDRVRVTEVRAPVAGEIKRLHLNTLGSVVQPGKDILELVPAEDTLLVEARLSPRDIAFIHPGQAARLRVTAYDHTVYGALAGEVQDISADSLSDEKGQPYYLVKVRTRPPTGEKGRAWRIIPGMVAQVDILTGKKSILSYLLKPVLRAKAESLSER